MARKFEVEVQITVPVTLREEAFTEKFMEEYRGSIAPFDTLGEHAEHIAWLVATGVIDPVYDPLVGGDQFVEGYGRIANFVIYAATSETVIDTISETEAVALAMPIAWLAGYDWAYGKGDVAGLSFDAAMETLGWDFDDKETEQFLAGADAAQNEQMDGGTPA